MFRYFSSDNLNKTIQINEQLKEEHEKRIYNRLYNPDHNHVDYIPSNKDYVNSSTPYHRDLYTSGRVRGNWNEFKDNEGHENIYSGEEFSEIIEYIIQQPQP